MLSIATSLPFSLEAASSTGSTKEIAGGLLFSDSLEQASGLTATSAARIAQSVRQARQEIQTGTEAAGTKTSHATLLATKEHTETETGDAEITAADSTLTSRAATPSSAAKANVLETVSGEKGTRTSESVAGDNVSLADHAEPAASQAPRPRVAQRQASLPRAAAAVVSDEKLDVPEKTKVNEVVGPRVSAGKPVADVLSSVCSSTAAPGPVVALAVAVPAIAAVAEKTVLPQVAVVEQLSILEGAGDKKVVSSEKSKSNGLASAPSSIDKSPSNASPSAASSLSPLDFDPVAAQGISGTVSTSEQHATAFKQPDTQKIEPAGVPERTYVTAKVASDVRMGVAALPDVAENQEQAKSSSAVATSVQTKRSVSEDREQAKAKAAGADAPAALVGVEGAGPAMSFELPVKSLATQAGVTDSAASTPISTAAIAPALSSGGDRRESTVGKTSPGITVAQIVGNSTELAPDTQNAQDTQENVVIVHASAEAMPVTAPTSDGGIDAHVLNGIAALTGRPAKTSGVAGLSRDRRSAAPTSIPSPLPKASEATGASSLASREAAPADRDVREASGHLAQTVVDEKKAVCPEDFASRIATPSAEVATQTPVAAAQMPSASGSSPSTPVPLASVIPNDAAGSIDSSSMQHTMLQATPTVLEVGVPGGTHGWLKIRAEIGEGGAVNASISSSTKDGQETLHRDLPGISAFLESERVPVSVQVGHVQAFAGALDSGKLEPAGSSVQLSSVQLLGDSGGSLIDAGAQQQSQREEPAVSPQGELRAEGREQSERQASSDRDEATWSPGDGYAGGGLAHGGNWLNVMA